jgi:hypothetical protein
VLDVGAGVLGRGLFQGGGVYGGDEGADDGIEEDREGGLIACCKDGKAEAVRVEEGDAGTIVVGYAV